MDTLKNYRNAPSHKAYSVTRRPEDGLYVVVFLVDGEHVGGGQFQDHESAEGAGVDFMFSGWGDD